MAESGGKAYYINIAADSKFEVTKIHWRTDPS
jgi:hypothetical protein